MTNFFLRSAYQAKLLGESHDRIQLMQQLADRTEWSYKDLSQFGQLMPVAAFRSEYDVSLYTLNDDCTDVMLYPQMYYINLLKDGTWSYHGLFDGKVFSDQQLEVVEEYVYNDVLKLERSST
tara:strand:- start:707 stop:1072 length:366 start_codon:yes stop_codon:yes gene_type:complete